MAESQTLENTANAAIGSSSLNLVLVLVTVVANTRSVILVMGSVNVSTQF